ncbi:MAG TPA: type II secretion system protein [Gemmatimonadaceae bacterium]|nr:type II secretion system protein [Gemmatimonadaceae bacterium]
MHIGRKAFTLVEILVVIMIVGVLAAIAIQRFGTSKSKAYLTAMKSDLRNLVTAEAGWFADSSRYSTDLSVIAFRQSSGVNAPSVVTGAGYWSATVTHSKLTGHTCGVAVNTANPIQTTAGEGEPVCN